MMGFITQGKTEQYIKMQNVLCDNRKHLSWLYKLGSIHDDVAFPTKPWEEHGTLDKGPGVGLGKMLQLLGSMPPGHICS